MWDFVFFVICFGLTLDFKAFFLVNDGMNRVYIMSIIILQNTHTHKIDDNYFQRISIL